MRVKRFVARNIQEAMLQVKIEMGKDAIILHTRKFKEGGFLGFFAKELFEVTAAVDNEYPISKKESPSKANIEQITWPQISEEIQDNKKVNIKNEVVGEKADNNPDKITNKDDSTELADMKKLMEEMMEQIESASLNIGINKTSEQFYQSLIANEVEEKLAKKLTKKCLENTPPTKYDDEDYIRDQFLDNIARILKKPRPIILPKKRKQQVYALVGPTGVGKTTTIAKLAANFTINSHKDIALITSDTYRIAAVEQLRTVGDIIGVPVEVVFTPQGLKTSVSNHGNKDLIFIDTAGRSHKNPLQMGELKGFLDAAEPDGIFLVLSATTKYKDMLDIISTYEKINFNRIIFTKLDETSTYGPILSTIQKSKKYLSYVTTGQSVPDDIEIVDKYKFAQLILRDGAK